MQVVCTLMFKYVNHTLSSFMSATWLSKSACLPRSYFCCLGYPSHLFFPWLPWSLWLPMLAWSAIVSLVNLTTNCCLGYHDHQLLLWLPWPPTVALVTCSGSGMSRIHQAFMSFDFMLGYRQPTCRLNQRQGAPLQGSKKVLYKCPADALVRRCRVNSCDKFPCLTEDQWARALPSLKSIRRSCALDFV